MGKSTRRIHRGKVEDVTMTHQTHRGRETLGEGKVAVLDKRIQGTAVAALQPNHRLLILGVEVVILVGAAAETADRID